MNIHSSSIISSKADIDSSVEIGPFCIIGDHVQIDEGTKILSHAVIKGPTRIGKNNIISEFLYDYNGYTFWFSISPRSIFPRSKIPKWFNVSFGYGSDGMIGEFKNLSSYKGMEIPNFERFRQFYLSLDVDFSKVNIENKFLEKIIKILSFVKIPAPTFEFSKNNVIFHKIYF